MVEASRIVMAESDPATRRMLKALLSPMGAEIITVESRERIEPIVGEANPDLLLIGLDFPNVADLVKSLVARFPDVGIVILSNGEDPDADLRCVRNGAADVLPKTPLDAARAMSVFRRALLAENVRSQSPKPLIDEVWSSTSASQLPQALMARAASLFEASTVRFLRRSRSGSFDVELFASGPKGRVVPRELDLALCEQMVSSDRATRLPSDHITARLPSSLAPLALNGMLLPVARDHQIVGALIVHREPSAGAFSRGDLQFGELTACLVEIATSHRDGLRELEERGEVLERAWQRIVEAQRLELMGRQAASLALGMQNPIAYLEGHLQFFSDFLDDAEGSNGVSLDVDSARRTLDDMRTAIHRISAAASELAQLARSREDVEFTLSKAVDSSIRMCTSLQAEVVVRVDDVVLRGNPGRFSQALTQLLENADQAMSASSSRLIRVHTRPTKGDRVLLCIEDRGEGIPEFELSLIAEPFYTKRQDASALGLGLSTARQVVQKMGGRLQIESSLGEGTTVVLDLPALGASDEILALGD